MRARSKSGAITVIALTVVAVLGLAGPASAHEERTVNGLHWAVGFGNEPVYTGQENSVQLLLKDKNDKPITNLGNGLKVAVAFGSQSLDLGSMEPFFEIGESGTPGDYRAWFFPTAPGKYTFHFAGSVQGTKVDESFTSSPTGFDEAQDPTGVEFPVKAPTTTQLNDKIDQQVPRVQAEATASANSAKDTADSAKTLGIIGIFVGALGLVTGGIALTTSRRKG